MFREFKEYQDIANLYQNKIYQTDEQIITESFESEKFTEEEAAFIEENFDALLEFVIEEETLSEQSTSDRMGAAFDKNKTKIPPKARVRSFSFNKGGQAVDKFKSALGKVGSKIGQFGKNVAKTATMQGSGAAKGSKFAAKGAKLLSKLGPAGKAAAVATVAGGAIAAGLANRAKKNKAAKDAAIDKQVDDYVAKRKKPVVPGTRINEIGAKGGGKPSEGDFKKDFPDKKPEVSKLTKQGKPRTKAQMMAAKRIASGKTIQQVKDENKASMKAKAAERFKAFKAKRAEKKLDKQRDFDDPDKKMNRGESYTPYDIVLEYLLSSEQVATIEEANYVMTEMDAETIQGIVEEQKKIFDEGLASMALKTGLVVGGAALAKKGLDKAKKSFDNYIDSERDKPGGGNTRPGADKIYFGDKKKK